eukprot:COSAG06_NODE_3331_length_5493_cov_4.197220_4_plen_136_part_00
MQNFTQTGLGRRRLWCFYRDETGTGSFPNWGAHSWEAAERNWGLVLENEGIGCAAEGSEEVRNASLLGGRHFLIQNDALPRQTRDKHHENKHETNLTAFSLRRSSPACSRRMQVRLPPPVAPSACPAVTAATGHQ